MPVRWVGSKLSIVLCIYLQRAFVTEVRAMTRQEKVWNTLC